MIKGLCNNKERRLWLENDESLYRQWQQSRLSKTEFIRKYRQQIDQYIAKKVGEPAR